MPDTAAPAQLCQRRQLTHKMRRMLFCRASLGLSSPQRHMWHVRLDLLYYKHRQVWAYSEGWWGECISVRTRTWGQICPISARQELVSKGSPIVGV